MRRSVLFLSCSAFLAAPLLYPSYADAKIDDGNVITVAQTSAARAPATSAPVTTTPANPASPSNPSNLSNPNPVNPASPNNPSNLSNPNGTNVASPNNPSNLNPANSTTTSMGSTTTGIDQNRWRHQHDQNGMNDTTSGSPSINSGGAGVPAAGSSY